MSDFREFWGTTGQDNVSVGTQDGDFVVFVGGVERARIKSDGTASGAFGGGGGGGFASLAAMLTSSNDAGGHTITDLGTPVNPTDSVTKSYVDARTLLSILTDSNDAGGLTIANLGAPVNPADSATKQYVDTGVASASAAHTLASVLAQGHDAGGVSITGLGAPVNETDAATKQYVDIPNQNTVTGLTYTFSLTDLGLVVTATNASGCTLTVPPSSTTNFPSNSLIIVRAGLSAGTITIQGGAGVTIRNPYYASGTTSYTLAGQAAEAKLIKVGTDIWSLNGEVT